MAESKTYYECFNNKLEEFLSDLDSSFPDIKDLKVVKSGLKLARTMDVKLPQTFFHEHVISKYEEQIINKDEEFFISKDYKYDAQTHGIDLDVVSKIKDIWKTLTDDDKEAIWKYLHVLIVLNRKCRSKK
jgi:hypothetical protein